MRGRGVRLDIGLDRRAVSARPRSPRPTAQRPSASNGLNQGRFHLAQGTSKKQTKIKEATIYGSEMMRARRGRVWERAGWGPNISARGDIARTSTLCPTYGTAPAPARAAQPAEKRCLIRTTTSTTQIH
ncbi:unnamed protein product [Spodoptera exigua]|nr:unnamed protein product [Spodoptera exigua]